MTRAIIFVFLSVFLCCHSYKILGIAHIPVGSHNILATRLFTEIAKRGHEVTFITPIPLKNPVKNLKQIPIESLQDVMKANFGATQDIENSNPFEMSLMITKLQYLLTEHLLSSEELQNLLKSAEKFDAVIIYQYLNDATQAIAHYFKAPLILFSSMPMYAPERFLLSYPTTSAFDPNILTEYTGKMNFWQRLRNTFYDATIISYYVWNYLPKYRDMVHKYISKDLDVYDFVNNASLALINSHVSTTGAVPLVPNAIEIGGYHIDQPKPLPNDLQKYLDDSRNGVIVFSMGSITKSIDFPKEKVDALIKSFGKLKENVLWKWENDQLEGLPKNVKIMKWLPQSDILAHPNVKAVISHGGLLSTMENVYYAKPFIGIPIFVDQKMNMAFATSNEFGIHVPYQELTEEKLTWALDQVLNNPKWKSNILQRSNIMRDRPLKPADNALFWIEYVIRHQGAPHLRYSGMDLTWYQRNLLDVAAFVIFLTLIPIIVIVKIFKKMLSKPKAKTKSKSKKE